MDRNTEDIISTLQYIVANMATKEDIDAVRAEMATKDDLANMATKEEMQEGFASLRAEMHQEFSSIRAELKDIRARLDALEAAARNVAGFSKEIDHLMERVRVIEKHLGIQHPVAA